MKYYVILIVTYSNGTADKVAIYSFTEQAEAIKNFYKYMAQFINADGVATVCVEAKNNAGGIYKNEAWVAPVTTEVNTDSEATE